MAMTNSASAALAANAASRTSDSSWGPWTVALNDHWPGSRRLPKSAANQAKVDGSWAK